MRILVLFVLALSVALSCSAESVVTNAVSNVVSVAVATNVSGTKSTFAKTKEDRVPRLQCEAVTKSGTRCKRYAVSDGKLCRQHQKISDRK